MQVCKRSAHAELVRSFARLVSFISLILLPTCTAQPEVTPLLVNSPLTAQSLPQHVVAVYSLQRMLPKNWYEVRVSYPATVRSFAARAFCGRACCVLARQAEAPATRARTCCP
jgi:hypothetical protein